MRFEAKRKSLSEAVRRVVVLTEALDTGAKNIPIQLYADQKSLYVRSVLGGQVVESVVREYVIEEPGVCSVEMTKFDAALDITGDLFKVVCVGRAMNFVCGRAKGHLALTGGGDNSPTQLVPEPDIEVKGFKAFLKALVLKGGVRDRTIHLLPEEIRGEATDSMHALIAVQSLPDKDEATVHSFSVQPDVLDKLVEQLDDGPARLGIGDRFFTLRTQDLALSIPRTSNAPLKLTEQLETWLRSLTHHARFTVVSRDLALALKDAVKLATKEGKLSIVFSPDRSRVIGDDGGAVIEVQFEATTTSTGTIVGAIQPSVLIECLKSFKPDDALTLDVYGACLVISFEGGSIHSQKTALPFVEPVSMGEPDEQKELPPNKKKASKKPPAPKPKLESEETVDDDEE